MQNINRKLKRTASSLVLGALVMSQAQSVLAKPVNLPSSKKWASKISPETKEIFLSHKLRPVHVRLNVGVDEGEDAHIRAILKSLSLSETYEVKQRASKDAVAAIKSTRASMIVLPDGRKAIYSAIVEKTKLGSIATSAMLRLDPTDKLNIEKDADEYRSLNNQMRRGAIPGESRLAAKKFDPLSDLFSLPAGVPETTVAPPVKATPVAQPTPALATTSKGGQTKTAALPAPIAAPVLSPTLTSSKPEPAAPALVVPPTVAKVTSLPTAKPSASSNLGKGVALGQIAAVLYAPLESSEVFVLFKDGSFHESMPRALEEWDLPGSKKADPESWGKWKRAGKDGEYEMKYGADDVVTISAAPVPPVQSGVKLSGEYGIEAHKDDAKTPGSIVQFDGDRFTLKSPKGTLSGTYRVEGYSIALSFDDGRTERRPFFFLPPEEEDDEPSIWFGDEVRSKVDA